MGHRIALMEEPTRRVRLTVSPQFYARTVFRIRSPLVPSGATGANPSLRNMPEVPNQLHSGTAAIFSETTGKASTIPPPCFLIDSRAACSAVLATPLPRWSRSTKKHVILHKLATRTAGAALRYVRLAVDPGELILSAVLTPADGSLAVVYQCCMRPTTAPGGFLVPT